MKTTSYTQRPSPTWRDLSGRIWPFESWLEEEGILEETTEHAIKAVISWQLQKTMEERGLSKKTMAALMGTSRSQLDRLLDPQSDAVTLKSLVRAARLVGKKIKIDLIDAV